MANIDIDDGQLNTLLKVLLDSGKTKNDLPTDLNILNSLSKANRVLPPEVPIETDPYKIEQRQRKEHGESDIMYQRRMGMLHRLKQISPHSIPEEYFETYYGNVKNA